jgi:hypothetical protein
MTGLPSFSKEQAEMQARYPMLSFEVIDRNGTRVAAWEGWLTPVRNASEVNAILSDLDADMRVLISDDDGTVLHDPTCTLLHPEHPALVRLKRPDRSFKVRIEYAGGPGHPKAYLLDPAIISANRRHIMGERRICAYPPWQDVWKHGRDSITDFTDHILVWLFKWNMWVESDHWPGSEMRHEPLFLFTEIKPEMQCWCGTGQPYAACCRGSDRNKVEAELVAMLALHSKLLQKPRYDADVVERIRRFLRPN